MKAPNPRLEVAGIDSLILRLFDAIDEANMPWMLAASRASLRGDTRSDRLGLSESERDCPSS